MKNRTSRFPSFSRGLTKNFQMADPRVVDTVYQILEEREWGKKIGLKKTVLIGQKPFCGTNTVYNKISTRIWRLDMKRY